MLRASATPASRVIPLAALAPLLPPDASSDSTDNLLEVFGRTQAAFAALGEGRRPVLLIDDVQMLDDTSAALLRHLLTTGTVFLLGTVRADQPPSGAVASLWAGDHARRFDVVALGRAEADDLLERALGAPVDGVARAELWAASNGSPLVLRELVLAALTSGALAIFDGVWRVAEALPVAGRVADLVLLRFATLSPEARAVLDDLAVGQPVGLADLELRHASDVIESVERAGFVSTRIDGRRVELTIAHPVHLEVLRRQLSPGQLRRLSTEHIARVEGHGGRRRDDPLRLARWYLDGTGSADPSVLLRASHLARDAADFATVERLTRAAMLAEPSVAAGRLLAEALYELGSFKEAEVEVERAEALATTDLERGLVAATRATNLFWGLVRPDDALAVIAAAEAQIANPDVRNELATRRASVSLHTGWPVRALDDLPELPEDGEEDARARVEAAMIRSAALALMGRTEESIEVSERGLAEHLTLADLSALAHPGTHIIHKVVALTEAGRLAEAWELAEAGYRVAVDERVPIAQMWFALQLGRIALIQGRVVTARTWFQEDVAHAGLLGHQHPLRLGLSGVTVAAGYLGDVATAAAAVAELDSFEGPSFGFFGTEMMRARAWCRLLEGDPAEGRALLLEAADTAREHGELTQEAAALYDHARIGGSAEVAAARLAELAAASDSRLVATWAQHIAGLAAADAAAVRDSADEFEALGAMLFAAEAVTAAAELFRRAGDARTANALANRASALVALCQGARTPALAASDPVVPLSARELEIASMVAAGLPSKQIAATLFLSVRTVQNHLQRIYAKLGVTSRAEVAAALAVVAPADRPRAD